MSCPICDKTSAPAYRPFCSKRCADVDLAKWLGGGYAIPSTAPEDAEDLAQALEEALEKGEDGRDGGTEDPDLPRLS
ncbi:DNA gyrase inhibitor YacG [Thalassorhabdomicrobium marinisediminis]|uniref:DNA gyrase inhibitor YacG n=1 Tax=Thalassorhabdomicrobium marinisediminis TaxID=2170577 RepID=UPI00248F4B87|nr:DNA gyrase inhibitor YacG [Thalassorhabdomicrobium marinisediminis]